MADTKALPSMTVKTAAKINLALDVTGRLPDGYHAIESVFQTVGIYDTVSVTLTGGEIGVSCAVRRDFSKNDPIPAGKGNIAYKAAELFYETTGLQKGCIIHISKDIPSQAGMGGGSTDAAAVLYCLNKLTGAGLDEGQLTEMGAKIGADVPFFFTGGTAYVSGIGEKIAPAADYSGRILVIAKGTEGVSTAQAYRSIDELETPYHPDTAGLLRALEQSPDEAWRYFGNTFEAAVQLDEVDRLKSAMLNKDALKANMNGSGSAVFGLFESREAADICADKLRSWGFWAEVCETVPESFIIPEQHAVW